MSEDVIYPEEFLIGSEKKCSENYTSPPPFQDPLWNPSLYLHNKQKWSPIFRMFGAVINIILNIILIPIYGIEGAAIATAVSYGLMFLFLFYKNQTWLPIKLAWNDIILLTLVISISIISFMYNMQGQYSIMGLVLLYICFLLYKHGIKSLVSLFK